MEASKPANIGIIGCGNISKAYFTSASQFPNLKVVACADMDADRARSMGQTYGVAAAQDVDALLADPAVDCVINLTVPQAHKEIDVRAFAAGKHVFSEKPMALTYAEGLEINAAAEKAGKRFGCAPDTVLGAGLQTARAALDAGRIGRPVAFAAAMQCRGHEHWHPSPEFYYQRGGGPVFDMGPYYLHALINLLGPVETVSAFAQTSFAEREIFSEAKRGQIMPVEIPTHVVGLLRFANGVSGTFTMSFDVRAPATAPVIEIYGEAGALYVPDPNQAYGEVAYCLMGEEARQVIPHSHRYAEGARGLGVSEMMAAVAEKRPHRANESIALHALEIMEALHESAAMGRHLELKSTCERPAAMPSGGFLP